MRIYPLPLGENFFSRLEFEEDFYPGEIVDVIEND